MIVSKLKIHLLDMLVWHSTKTVLNLVLPHYYRVFHKTKFISPRIYTRNEVIISLTSIPKRIDTISVVLESLFRQTVKADKIILWLADTQFPDKQLIYSELSSFIERGLLIKFCDDLKSHKKYYYSIKDNPNAYVVTCDDDIIYSEHMLERLLQTSNKYPNAIVCERAHEITFLDGRVRSYADWNYRARGVRGPSCLLCPTSGAGCLFPPYSLSPHVFDCDQIKELCLYADDIWLKCMSYMIKTPVVLTRVNNPEIIDLIGTNTNSLAKVNVEGNLNDEQFKSVSNYYSIQWKAEEI